MTLSWSMRIGNVLTTVQSDIVTWSPSVPKPQDHVYVSSLPYVDWNPSLLAILQAVIFQSDALMIASTTAKP